jgi:hypothetical protein
MFDDEDAIVSHTTVLTAPGWYVTTLGDGELSDLPIVAWEVERYECTKGRYRGNVDRTIVPILLDNNFNLDRDAWLIRDPSGNYRNLSGDVFNAEEALEELTRKHEWRAGSGHVEPTSVAELDSMAFGNQILSISSPREAQAITSTACRS